jgi:hypothetical protein
MKEEFLLHIFHIFFVGVFFGYIGVQRTRIPDLVFPLLIVIGAFVILHHALIIFRKGGKIINWIHVLLVGPLLVYIGYFAKKTPTICFDFMLLLAFASIGYHTYTI